MPQVKRKIDACPECNQSFRSHSWTLWRQFNHVTRCGAAKELDRFMEKLAALRRDKDAQ